MSEQAKKPAFKFLTNVPVTVKTKWEKPYEGKSSKDNEPYTMHTVEIDGQEEKFFGNTELDNLLSGYPKGTFVQITKKEFPQEGKKPRIGWVVSQVNQPLFDGKGTRTEEPEKSVVKDEATRGDYRMERKKRLREAFEDVLEVCSEVKVDLTPDAFQRIAVSLIIEEGKLR